VVVAKVQPTSTGPVTHAVILRKSASMCLDTCAKCRYIHTIKEKGDRFRGSESSPRVMRGKCGTSRWGMEACLGKGYLESFPFPCGDGVLNSRQG
jgi:hypothetical protein